MDLPQYFVEEEIKSLRALIIAYAIFIVCAINGFIGGKIAGIKLMENWQFGIMVAGNILSGLFAGWTISKRKHVFAAKYILFAVMAAIITLGMFWMSSSWIFLGYYLLVALAGFFYEWKICLYAGLICTVLFSALFFTVPFFSPAETVIWLVYFLPLIGAVTFINRRNRLFIEDILKKQQETEEAKTALEVRVAARTRELKELAGGLEERAKERTKEIQKKVADLERFQRLAVGRELKMIELKREIKKLGGK